MHSSLTSCTVLAERIRVWRIRRVPTRYDRQRQTNLISAQSWFHFYSYTCITCTSATILVKFYIYHETEYTPGNWEEILNLATLHCMEHRILQRSYRIKGTFLAKNQVDQCPLNISEQTHIMSCIFVWSLCEGLLQIQHTKKTMRSSTPPQLQCCTHRNAETNFSRINFINLLVS